MTKHPDIFAALSAPFADDETRWRWGDKGKTFKLTYITARTAMNRLDVVLGPENWWDRYVAAEDSVLCELTIRLPDGSTVTKCDAGGYAGMADSGDDDKSGYSDAFKRAAVKFGVARYLYKDGVPSFAQEPPAPADGRSPAPAAGKPAGETWAHFISGRLRKLNGEWLREMAREGIEPDVRAAHKELANEPRVVNHLCSRLIELGKLRAEAVGKAKDPTVRDPTHARNAVKCFFEKSPNAIRTGVEKYLAKKLSEARARLGMPDLSDDTPGNGEPVEEALSN